MDSLKQEIAEEHLRNRDKLSRTLDGIDMIRNDNRDDHMNRDKWQFLVNISKVLSSVQRVDLNQLIGIVTR